MQYPRPHRAGKTPAAARALAAAALGLLLITHALPRAPRHALAARQSQAPPPAKEFARAEFVPGEILVRFRDRGDFPKGGAADALSLRDSGGGEVRVRLEGLDAASEMLPGLRLARVDEGLTADALAALSARPDVLYAEPNYRRRALQRAPNDPRYRDQWGLKNLVSPGVDIGAEAAWATTTGDRGVVIGVVDEGVDVTHPDLRDNVWSNPGEVEGNGADDDGNGYADDVHGWDFLHDDPTVFDGAGDSSNQTDAHGTHVAGIAGAVGDNGLGVTGVNWRASIMPLKVLGAEGGSVAGLVRAFAYAKRMRELFAGSGGARGANVRALNNSYGGPGASRAELDAIRSLNDAGILFVAAAGNESMSNDVSATYPASYDAPNVVSVAAVSRSNLVPDFSNYGPARSVHLGAPGAEVLSTTPNGTYAFASGTSMAAPHVAGAAALLCAARPDLTVSRLRAALVFSGDQFQPELIVTGRRLNVGAALANAAEQDVTPPALVNTLRVTAQSGRRITLSWIEPGDDGGAGQAAFHELRYGDSPGGEQILLRALRPGAPGSRQTVTVNVPARHAGGLVSLKTYDSTGNATASVVGVAVPADEADPYTPAEGAPAALTTGGDRLGLRGDDVVQNYVRLPFPFPFFGAQAEYVAVSSNGALYVLTQDGGAPIPRGGSVVADGAAPSVAHLDRLRVIAGLWNDLRTDRREGDGVYVVRPDADRIVFRWQAVTYDLQLASGARRGENPVNFEIELRTDGTIVTRYGDGNQNVLPVVGISGGDPEPYVIASHTSEGAMRSLANAPSVVFAPRAGASPLKADIDVAVTAAPHPVAPGQTLTYTTGVVNLGPDAAESVTVTNLLPAGTTFVSCTTPCAAPADGRTVTTNVGPLPVGASFRREIKITVRVDAPAGTTLEHRVSVAGNRPDPNPTNNAWVTLTGVVAAAGLSDVRAVAAGAHCTYAVRGGGTLWNWGQCYSTTGLQSVPTRAGTITGIKSVSAGPNFVLALLGDGTVWAIGYNLEGQLGDGTTTSRADFVRVKDLTDVKAISAGFNHSAALKSDGTVWTWGAGAGPAPARVDLRDASTAVAAGYLHTLALRADGTVWAWGDNRDGRLGDGTTIFRQSPVQVSVPGNFVGIAAGGSSSSGGHSLAVRADGAVFNWGVYGGINDYMPRPTPAQTGGVTAASAAAGARHSLAIGQDGAVYNWGILHPTTSCAGGGCFPTTAQQVAGLSGVTQVAGAYRHSAALLADGSVWTWGENEYGQLGDGTQTNRSAPVRVSSLSAVERPVFSPGGGAFAGPQHVTVSCATPGATIRYTTNGREPTERDPVIASGAPLLVERTTTLSARAFRPDMQPSAMRSEIYTITGAQQARLQFQSAAFVADEGTTGRSALITVTRTGDSSGAASVAYATEDDPADVPCAAIVGAAYARCDYASTVDTLRFAPNETSKTFAVPLIDDTRPEADERLQLRLSNPSGASLGETVTATLTITDNDNDPAAANPALANQFFVRQQYLDFLSREPEPGEPWTGVLGRCPNVFNTDPNSPSARCDRLHVSRSFFQSPEFQLKGFYAYLFYRVAFNRRPAYEEITPDMRGLAGATGEEVFARRAALATAMTQRPEFAQLYGHMSSAQYVAALLGRYGLNQITTEDPRNPEGATQVTLTSQQLIDSLNTNTLTRAQVLRSVVQSNEVDSAEYLGAFVSMQYYGYLRRTPEQSGYDAWLRVIRQDPNNIRVMVGGFVNSQEYALRFGRP